MPRSGTVRDTTRKKYLLIPGPVTSSTDGDFHWVGAGDLARLYGVRMSECVIGRPDRPPPDPLGHLHVLRPRRDGNYHLPRQEQTQ